MRFAVTALALLALPLAAFAQEEEAGGAYAYAYAGQAKHELSRPTLDLATLGVLEGLAPVAIRSSVDDSTFGFGVMLGYRMSPHVGLEAGYVTLGESTYRAEVDVAPATLPPATGTFRAQLSARGATLGLAAFVPIGSRFDVHARGGVLFARSEITTTLAIAGDTTDPDRSTGNSRDGWYGYGVGWSLSERLQVTVDSTHFRGVGDVSETIPKTISLLGASMLYRF